MKKPFTVIYKKSRKPKIPKELMEFFTPETKVELVKPGFAIGISPGPTAKPHGKK